MNRARNILFKAYWSAQGWVLPPRFTAEEFAFARQAGMMFEPRRLDHDQVVHWLQQAVAAVTLEAVCEAFLSSLGARRLELRSALGSYAIARHFPDHRYAGDDFCCALCGVFEDPVELYDLSAYNFERYKWGGVSHGDPVFMAFDLGQFSQVEFPPPGAEDLAILRDILAAAHSCPPEAKPRHLERRLAGLFASNAHERQILLQILGYCGILQPPSLPGYREGFVPYAERREPNYNRFWKYPFCWWRGAHRVNEAALAEYFPSLA